MVAWSRRTVERFLKRSPPVTSRGDGGDRGRKRVGEVAEAVRLPHDQRVAHGRGLQPKPRRGLHHRLDGLRDGLPDRESILVIPGPGITNIVCLCRRKIFFTRRSTV